MSDERCETCRFWKRDEMFPESTYGECRRYPPTGNINLSESSWFPLTVNEDWCGEWQARALPTTESTRLQGGLYYAAIVTPEGTRYEPIDVKPPPTSSPRPAEE